MGLVSGVVVLPLVFWSVVKTKLYLKILFLLINLVLAGLSIGKAKDLLKKIKIEDLAEILDKKLQTKEKILTLSSAEAVDEITFASLEFIQTELEKQVADTQIDLEDIFPLRFEKKSKIFLSLAIIFWLCSFGLILSQDRYFKKVPNLLAQEKVEILRELIKNSPLVPENIQKSIEELAKVIEDQGLDSELVLDALVELDQEIESFENSEQNQQATGTDSQTTKQTAEQSEQQKQPGAPAGAVEPKKTEDAAEKSSQGDNQEPAPQPSDNQQPADNQSNQSQTEQQNTSQNNTAQEKEPKQKEEQQKQEQGTAQGTEQEQETGKSDKTKSANKDQAQEGGETRSGKEAASGAETKKETTPKDEVKNEQGAKSEQEDTQATDSAKQQNSEKQNKNDNNSSAQQQLDNLKQELNQLKQDLNQNLETDSQDNNPDNQNNKSNNQDSTDKSEKQQSAQENQNQAQAKADSKQQNQMQEGNQDLDNQNVELQKSEISQNPNQQDFQGKPQKHTEKLPQPSAAVPSLGEGEGAGASLGQDKNLISIGVDQKDQNIFNPFGQEEKERYLNKNAAVARTKLQDGEFEKPNSTVLQEKQPIPVEYQEILK
jgi:hypothetical protein